MLVQEFLERSADRLPDKPCLSADGVRLTYAEVEQRANRLAHALVAAGVRRGDRVVVSMPNVLEAPVALFAALKAGGAFVFVNPDTPPDKLRYVLGDSEATAFLGWAAPPTRAALEAVLASRAALRVVGLAGPEAGRLADGSALAVGWDDLLAGQPADRPPRVNIDLDLACLIYTSGSTGRPKGVICGHDNVVFASGSIIEYVGNVEDDVIYNALPLSFDYGLYQVLMGFRVGGRVVLGRGFTYPARILEEIVRERVTGLPGVPTLFALLLRMDLEQYDLSSLRYMTNTAAALPTVHVRELRRRLPWVRLIKMYGLTETKRTLWLPPEEVDRRPGSVGIAIPGTEVWLEDDEGRPVGPGEIGELVARGRHVMRGYWNDPEASAARFPPGPLPGERVCRTGDLFRRDEDGFYYFVARRDDVIKTRGEKVAPREVESVLLEHPGVLLAAVRGVDDPLLGQAIEAHVVPREEGLDVAELRRHCARHLEPFARPKAIHLVDELPHTSSGKVLRRALDTSPSDEPPEPVGSGAPTPPGP
ncbi:MAG: class I adenylate-forming enzyme family protein [Acidobacteriota bacterium]